MHWSEVAAQRALERTRSGEEVVIGSGISLSGPVHVGHSREFLTAALIAHAVKKNGGRPRFIAFADDMDPLRKVYPFLTPDYNRWVGCPLYRIPDPYGCHTSYADHFLQELLDGFQALKISPEVIRSSEMYNSGRFSDLVEKTLVAREEVNEILDQVAGGGRGAPRKAKKSWLFQPECPRCFSLQRTRIIAMSGSVLSIYCDVCGEEFEINLQAGGGKLVWRCDWPMRWAYLGVAVEPFGHDHSAAGGSYESGQIFAERIYGIRAPVPVPYGWIHFKSGGAMHSSSGKAISVTQLATAYPPKIIWWMIARRDPAVTIPFDPETTLLEEARLLRDTTERGGSYRESAVIVESVVGIRQSLLAYPFDHLTLVAQLSQFQPDFALEILRRSRAYQEANVSVTQNDMEYIRKWLEFYGEHYRIRMREPGEPVAGARADLRPTLYILQSNLQEIDWEAQLIHNTVHETAKNAGVKAGDLFAELYRHVISQDRGPKIGWLFETLGRSKILQLLA
ncbi:MAG: Lysine-tRNA ligase [Parcubacteria group bacterium GW2011_GWB1_50_9]|nr:MAG: Lysine-tRNA ligase [Parcubacteria group bacterium GW2011_GWB1_50_9]